MEPQSRLLLSIVCHTSAVGLINSASNPLQDGPVVPLLPQSRPGPHHRDPNLAWSAGERVAFVCAYTTFFVALCVLVRYRCALGRVFSRSKDVPKTAAGAQVLLDDCEEAAPSVGLTPAYPSEQRVFELFEAEARRSPDAVALVLAADEAGCGRRELSYAELAELFEELAAKLNSMGITKGSVVALAMHRSLAQVVAVWGVLKSGAAFLPIDADMPRARQELMVSESGAAAIICADGDQDKVQLGESLGKPVLCMSTEGQHGAIRVMGSPGRQSCERVRPESNDMALLIYTSGTTGTPKGIVYDHRHLSHGVHFWGELCEMTAKSVAMLKSPYFWAVIEYEMFPALCRGARLVITAPNGHKNPDYLVKTIEAEAVDALLITASVLSLIADLQQMGGKRPLRSLRHVVNCGEAFAVATANDVVKKLGPTVQVHNMYGASESSCAIYTVPSSGVDTSLYSSKVPAGRPQPHVTVYVMKESPGSSPASSPAFEPASSGQEGEILFGGVTAVGYFQREELTATKWMETAHGRLYRTGDLGRWTAGQLEVVGRVDRQVKIRGVRIEPEEVEATLRKFRVSAATVSVASTVSCSTTDLELGGAKETLDKFALKDVAVVPSDEPAELVAFVSLRDGVSDELVSEEDLRSHCRACLMPAYVPKFFVILPAASYPLLPNGKPNLSELKGRATAHVEEEGDMVMDSLGQMKKMSGWAITERNVIHRCYAYWMLGVLIDHYCRCGMGHPTPGFCTQLASSALPPWVEIVLRTIGNDQDMFGFILLGAYQDSQPERAGGQSKVKFGKKDLFVFFVYVIMAVPLTQIFSGFGVLQSGWAYHEVDWNSSNHRWYLFMVFMARLYLQICEWLRVPGLLQCLLIMAPVFVPEHGPGLLDFCSPDAATAQNYALSLLFRTAGRDSCPIFPRFVLIYLMGYVWAFHCVRPATRLLAKRLPSGPTWAAASLGASMVLGLTTAMVHYPNTTLETGTGMPWLPFEVAVGFVQPVLFALAMTHLPINAAWWGNTSLGCYVFHFYLRSPMTQAVAGIVGLCAFDATGLSALLLILALCVAVMTVLGPLGHYFLVGLQRAPSLLALGASRLRRQPAQRAGTARPH